MQYVSRTHHYIGNRRQENNGLWRIGVPGQISRGSSGLLHDALEHFGVNRDDSVVFDGVRHPEILADIRHVAEATIAVYLDANQEERFRRHQTRQAFSWSLEEFLTIDRHPVEAGIGRMIEQCDLVVDGARPITDVQNMLRDQLSKWIRFDTSLSTPC